MKKITKKGLVSLAATAALMAGTAGTFALWFDTAALGADTDAISTGNLALSADSAGTWVWSHRSYNNGGIVLYPAPGATNLADSHLLVPGDAVTFNWADGIDQYLVVGTTLEATLYLDGISALNTALPQPLVLLVDGEVLNATSAFTIGTTTVDNVTVWELPSIVVGFPVHGGESGHGHLPGETGNDYGRNIGSDTSAAIDVSGLQLRLQQIVTPSDAGEVFRLPTNG